MYVYTTITRRDCHSTNQKQVVQREQLVYQELISHKSLVPTGDLSSEEKGACLMG